MLIGLKGIMWSECGRSGGYCINIYMGIYICEYMFRVNAVGLVDSMCKVSESVYDCILGQVCMGE